MNKDEYKRHIEELIEEARPMIYDALASDSIGCIDQETRKGQLNVPGSAFLLEEIDPSLLRKWFQANIGKDLTVFLHIGCGFLFARGYESYESQRFEVLRMTKYLLVLAGQYNVKLVIILETAGTANQFFTK